MAGLVSHSMGLGSAAPRAAPRIAAPLPFPASALPGPYPVLPRSRPHVTLGA